MLCKRLTELLREVDTVTCRGLTLLCKRLTELSREVGHHPIQLGLSRAVKSNRRATEGLTKLEYNAVTWKSATKLA